MTAPPGLPDGPGYAVRTDIGLQRTGNEDRYLARSPMFAVADGMGGHQGGEVASQLAVDLLGEASDLAPIPDPDAIVDALERSNVAIRVEARRNLALAGMGTTCTVAVIRDEIRVAHVGDSRAYRFRDGSLEQLTEDHTLVASMVREGIMQPDDARTDGRRNIITRALGAEDGVRVDVMTADLASGDRVLLCTDGLHGQVADTAIAGVLGTETDPGRAADRLVDLANAAGGDDNVTVIVIDVDLVVAATADLAGTTSGRAAADVPTADVIEASTADALPSTAAASARGRRRPSLRTLIVLLAVVALILAIVLVTAQWLASTAPATGSHATATRAGPVATNVEA